MVADVAPRRHPTRFHEWFDGELTRLGWGDREAARRLALNHVTIGGLRNGSVRNPEEATMAKVAAGLSQDVEILYRWLRERPVAEQASHNVLREKAESYETIAARARLDDGDWLDLSHLPEEDRQDVRDYAGWKEERRRRRERE